MSNFQTKHVIAHFGNIHRLRTEDVKTSLILQEEPLFTVSDYKGQPIWTIDSKNGRMVMNGLIQSTAMTFFPIDQNPTCDERVLWLNECNHHLYFGDQDLIVPPIGPTGPDGENQSQGEDGPPGFQGPVGYIGPPSLVSGSDGPGGPKGQVGHTGHDGKDGSKARDGEVGEIGIPGPDGRDGVSKLQLIFNSTSGNVFNSSTTDAVSGKYQLNSINLIVGQVLRLDCRIGATSGITGYVNLEGQSNYEIAQLNVNNGLNEFTTYVIVTATGVNTQTIRYNDLNFETKTVVIDTKETSNLNIDSGNSSVYYYSSQLFSFLPNNSSLQILNPLSSQPINNSNLYTYLEWNHPLTEGKSIQLLYNVSLTISTDFQVYCNESKIYDVTVNETGPNQVNIVFVYDGSKLYNQASSKSTFYQSTFLEIVEPQRFMLKTSQIHEQYLSQMYFTN